MFVNRLFARFDIPPIALTAIVSAVVLASIVAWDIFAPAAKPALVVAYGSGTSTPVANISDELGMDPVASASTGALLELQGAIAGLKSNGTYSSTTAAQVANQIGQSTRAKLTYAGYRTEDIQTDIDTSVKRTVTYKKALETSLQPLMQNKMYELDLFGKYTETKDPIYLTKMHAAAANYFAAASSTAKVVAPQDALLLHVAILNAMVEFGTVVNAIADHAQDPIAAAMLIHNYNQAESDMTSSFGDLARYWKNKSL